MAHLRDLDDLSTDRDGEIALDQLQFRKKQAQVGAAALLPETLNRPGVKAAGNGGLMAARLGRDMQADDSGIVNQRRKIPRFEEELRLGMNGVKAPLRQCVMQFSRSSGKRGERRRAEDRQAHVGEALVVPAPAAQRE